MKYKFQPFSRRRERTLSVDENKEAIRLLVDKLSYRAPRVEVGFYASAMFPPSLTDRYDDPERALVLVLVDVDQQDSFAVRVADGKCTFPAPPATHMETPPPLPLAPYGKPARGRGSEGGDVNGTFWFETVTPVHRPSVFLYLVLENFVSNAVGLDLIGQQAINY